MADDAIAAEIDAISIARLDLWREIQGDPPEIIYHYTNAEGLVGIISSGALWATDLRFVNDATELDHALGSMLSAVGRARDKFSRPAQLMLLDRLAAVIALKEGFPSVHSISFSADGDLLSQWRAYGGSGSGYAIGFGTGELLPDFGYGIPAGGGSIHRVIYDSTAQDDILDGVIAQGCELIEGISSTGGEVEFVAQGLVRRLLSGSESGLFYCLKEEGWAEEVEWRTIYALPAGAFVPIEFRIVGGIPVPYLSLEDNRKGLPIRKVVLGPSTPTETAETAVASLLGRYGYAEVEIQRSAIPLRW